MPDCGWKRPAQRRNEMVEQLDTAERVLIGAMTAGWEPRVLGGGFGWGIGNGTERGLGRAGVPRGAATAVEDATSSDVVPPAAAQYRKARKNGCELVLASWYSNQLKPASTASEVASET